VPQVFMQDFANEDHFVPKNDEIVYNQYKFGVLVDPWTIHDPSDITPREENPQHPFYKRVDFLWKTGKYMDFVMKWNSMCQKMSRKLSKSKMQLEGSLDNPTKLKLCSIHLADKEYLVPSLGRLTYWVSPYEDGKDNKYKKTFENRGDSPEEAYYLGCKTRLQANCNN
jgi:hypothetical protein